MTDEEFAAKYMKLAAFMAWKFVRNTNKALARQEQIDARLGSADADDFTGDALLKLMRCPKNKRDQPAYVKRLIINSLINSLNKRMRLVQNEVFGDVELPDSKSPLQSLYHLAEHDLASFDDQLPSSMAAVVKLYYGIGCEKELSEKEIAKKLGRTQWWVRMRLERGLAKLRSRVVPTNPGNFPCTTSGINANL